MLETREQAKCSNTEAQPPEPDVISAANTVMLTAWGVEGGMSAGHIIAAFTSHHGV